MTPQEIIMRPLITERATTIKERFNQVAFQVQVEANKHQIRDAVEVIYGVKVTRVRTSVVPGKQKRRGASIGKLPNWKKAVVTLKTGDTIDFFAQE
jgi:large subunit ribosomal protein L23